MLSRFCVNGSTIQIVFGNCFKGLTFWILNKNFQEKTSLCIVLTLFIHKLVQNTIVTTASELNLSLMLPTFIKRITFCEDVGFRFWTLFDMQLITFIGKYFLLFILDF